MKRTGVKPIKNQSPEPKRPVTIDLPWFFPTPDSVWISKLLDEKSSQFNVDNGTILDFLASSLVSSSTDSTGVVSLLVGHLLWSDETLSLIQRNEKQNAFLSSLVSVADVKRLASHLNPSFVTRLLSLFKNKLATSK